MGLEEDTDSFMHLKLYLEGDGDFELKVPTFWDAVKEKWMGCLKLPKSQKLIHAHGKDSRELENNFNIELSKTFRSSHADELFSLFKKVQGKSIP